MLKKKIISLLMVMTIALTFVGCDNKVGDIALEKGQTAIHISKDGKVQYGVAESFDKDYYDKKELKSTVENEVDEFNSDSDASGKDALSLKSMDVKKDVATMIMEFASTTDFGTYILKYNNIEKYINIANETFIIDSYSKQMKNQDTVASTNKSVTEPFTVLLLGVDSEYDGLSNNAAFNGDSIMLITFNPKTLSATIFSIPRDTYVPIACNNNKSNKINSAAGYGTKCMIDTIQNLIDINIDYYVKINFKGVVSLVDALGGVTLDIDKPDFRKNGNINCGDKICEQDSNRSFGENLVYITPGPNQTINGEQALAYSRNRHQFASSDFKRIEHQQAVVTAIANKTKTIRSIDTFYKLLNAVSNNIDTNMSTKEILNFYNVGKNILLNNNFDDNNFINIQKTYLSGYDLTIYQNGYDMYTFQYYENSLKEIVKAMKENLELQETELIKTFSFSINKEFTIPVIGKNVTSGTRNETLPNFIGSSIEYVKEWASSRNITITEEEYTSNDCENNKITNQDIRSGTLTNNIDNLKVTVCKNIAETEE